jgi:enoyl-CoA hydratase/carnithine racemase
MPNVHVVREGAVATIVLDDPARKNAMSVDLGDALRQRVRELAADSTLRAAVITGAGGAFSAGGDLSMLERLRTSSSDEARAFMLEFYAKFLSVLDLGVPVIAAVDGPAIGAGLALALACHLAIVGEDAKLALNFASLGLYPGMGSTYFAPRRMGEQRAAEILLTGRRFDGREAVGIGAALEAVPSSEVLPRAKALAQTIADQGPLATRALADALGPDRPALAAALEREAREQARSYASEDLGEGLRAAAERRKPVFVGK